MKKIKCIHTENETVLMIKAFAAILSSLLLFVKSNVFFSLGSLLISIILLAYIYLLVNTVVSIYNHFTAKDILLDGLRIMVHVDDICHYNRFGKKHPCMYLNGRLKNPETAEEAYTGIKTLEDYDSFLEIACSSCNSKDKKTCGRCSRASKFLKYHTMFFYVYFDTVRGIAAVDLNNLEFTESANEKYTNYYTYNKFED